jgi:hypothetical protein
MAPTRLISTSDLSFETRYAHLTPIERDYPRYAILSHRWGDDEITYQEFMYFTSSEYGKQPSIAKMLGFDDRRRDGNGFQKIMNAVKKAADLGFQWLWCDCVCINKDSSAELSEAINSMYAWYRDAALCIVHLSDVADLAEDQTIRKAVLASRWWTRGWTLQEFIAPRKLQFYTADWIYLTDKIDLASHSEIIAGIPSKYILRQNNEIACVAERLRWAAGRATTRPEDLAYCLLGLATVNMPLLYGEGGARAWRRLQEAIASTVNDDSIYAIKPPMHKSPKAYLFARRPSEFMSGLIGQAGGSDTIQSITNIGIRTWVTYVDLGGGLMAVALDKCRLAEYPVGRVYRAFKPGYLRPVYRLDAGVTQVWWPSNISVEDVVSQLRDIYSQRHGLLEHSYREVILAYESLS